MSTKQKSNCDGFNGGGGQSYLTFYKQQLSNKLSLQNTNKRKGDSLLYGETEIDHGYLTLMRVK